MTLMARCDAETSKSLLTANFQAPMESKIEVPDQKMSFGQRGGGGQG